MKLGLQDECCVPSLCHNLYPFEELALCTMHFKKSLIPRSTFEPPKQLCRRCDMHICPPRLGMRDRNRRCACFFTVRAAGESTARCETPPGSQQAQCSEKALHVGVQLCLAQRLSMQMWLPHARNGRKTQWRTSPHN